MAKTNLRSPTQRSAEPGIRISPATLTILGSLFALIVGVWQVGSRIATKSDVDAIAAQLGPRMTQIEARLRELELQNAAHWGASPASITHGLDDDPPVTRAGFLLTQYAQQMPLPPSASASAAPPPLPLRTPVLTLDFIRAYQMQPTRGGYYPLLGQDGRLYALDGWVAIMTQLHMQDTRQQLQRLK